MRGLRDYRITGFLVRKVRRVRRVRGVRGLQDYRITGLQDFWIYIIHLTSYIIHLTSYISGLQDFWLGGLGGLGDFWITGLQDYRMKGTSTSFICSDIS